MLKYVDRLRTQRESVESLEDAAAIAEKAAREARERASNARFAYDKRVSTLVPKTIPTRDPSIFPLSKDEPTSKGKPKMSAKREADIRREVLADLA